MDKETVAQIREDANTLGTMALRIELDTGIGKTPDYDVIMALVNRAGKAVAALRGALELVAEDQR